MQVFDDLFDRDGCTIGLRPAPEYGAVGEVRFAEVVAAGSRLGHSALGYRFAASGEVVINPAKSAVHRLGTDDEILVVSGSRSSIRADREEDLLTG